MLGKRYNIAVPNNGGLFIVFSVDTEQDMTSWEAVTYVYDPAYPSVVLDTLTTTISASSQTITLEHDADSINALLSSNADDATLAYACLVKPNTLYGIRFFYGDFSIMEGGPEWVVSS